MKQIVTFIIKAILCFLTSYVLSVLMLALNLVYSRFPRHSLFQLLFDEVGVGYIYEIPLYYAVRVNLLVIIVWLFKKPDKKFFIISVVVATLLTAFISILMDGLIAIG